MIIKACSIDTDYSSYEELKKRSVVAQGWRGGGDVSFFKEERNNIWKFIDFIESKIDKKNSCKNAFTSLFDIKPGDIILAMEGHNIKGICEMPQNFEYVFQEYDYPNSLFPVNWVDWNDLSDKEPPKGYSRLRYPIFNIGEKRPDIKKFIKSNWQSYKEKNNIQIQLEHCNEKLNVIVAQFPQKVKESKERYYLMLKNKETMAKNQKYIDLLNANKNLVLTGAPGTGKTFLAKQLAMIELFKKDSEELLSDDEKKLLEQRCVFVQFHPSYDYTDFVEGLRPKKEPGQKEIGFELKDGIFMEFCKRAKNDKKNDYFFIIDEINRAEISKVFGELFFSIDPGYRGEKGKVKTQYANLREENDQYFYVPENVYIIGTMNDIDRSVESFDFAMRRRFVWEEISAEESAENMRIDEPTKSRMKILNKAIEDIEGLNSSYHIGAAYFLKLKNYDNDYEKLWKNHLKPLVKEYLRGLPEAKKQLDIEKTFLLKKSKVE